MGSNSTPPARLVGMESSLQRGEILVAHDPNAGEVTEVRNLVLQSSLAQLRSQGLYDRYAISMDPAALEDLLTRVAPGWVPVQLAMAHYRACEDMQLTNDELNAMGRTVGERLQETTLVSSAKKMRPDDFDPWQIEAQMHRMWQRLYRGGSVQVTKLGPKEKQIEHRGCPMNRFRYFRFGVLMALTAAHNAVGLEIARIGVDQYDPLTHEVTFRLSWI